MATFRDRKSNTQYWSVNMIMAAVVVIMVALVLKCLWMTVAAMVVAVVIVVAEVAAEMVLAFDRSADLRGDYDDGGGRDCSGKSCCRDGFSF